MNSGLIISRADGRPMYLQIMEQIKQKIAVGDWEPGQQIPSIRHLAAATQVSVITVKRAYLELEREGVIVTRHGKGSHVAEDSDIGSRLRDQDLEQSLDQAVRMAALLGMSPEELARRLRVSAERLSEKEQI
jgi:GntR family transcriptional regulator